MTVLVTGGAGFLGSHLCARLLADGHEVVSVDNYFTSARRNLATLLDNPRFEAIRALLAEARAIFEWEAINVGSR